jgi:hypothetical protein
VRRSAMSAWSRQSALTRPAIAKLARFTVASAAAVTPAPDSERQRGERLTSSKSRRMNMSEVTLLQLFSCRYA